MKVCQMVGKSIGGGERNSHVRKLKKCFKYALAVGRRRPLSLLKKQTKY